MLANDEKQVTQLLELGAQSSIGDRTGVTPVMSAAEHGHIEVLQTLALKGINAGGGPIAVEIWEREGSRCSRILVHCTYLHTIMSSMYICTNACVPALMSMHTHPLMNSGVRIYIPHALVIGCCR